MKRWTRTTLLAATAWCVLVAPAQAADPPEVRNLPAYTLRAENASGAVTTVTGHLGILRSVPAQLTAPAPGASLAGDATARLLPTAGYTLSSVRFSASGGGSRNLLYLQLRKPSLTIPRVQRGMRVTVQVRAAALLGGTPPTTTKSIKVTR